MLLASWPNVLPLSCYIEKYFTDCFRATVPLVVAACCVSTNTCFLSNNPFLAVPTLSKQEWYHLFLSEVITSPAEVATQINIFLTNITQEFEPWMTAQTPPNIIPSDLLVSLEEFSSTLRKLPTQTVKPDGISNKIYS